MRKLIAGLCALFLIGGLAACSSKGADEASTTTKAKTDQPTTTKADDGGDETTTTEGGGEVDPEAEPFVTSLAAGLDAGDPDDGDIELSEDESACVAPLWVEAIGVDTFEDNDVDPADLEDPDFSFPELGLEEDQGFAMVDAFLECDVDVFGQLDELLTSDLDETQTECLRGELDQDLAREFLAAAAISDDIDPALEKQLDAIDAKCKLSEE